MAINGGDKIELMEPEIEGKMEQQQGIFNKIKRFFKGTRRQNFIKNQIERMSAMTLSDMINDPITEILVFRYLLNEHQLGLIEIKSLWQCYKTSEQILWNIDLINDREKIELLLHSCPPIVWEHNIMNLVEQSKTLEIAKENKQKPQEYIRYDEKINGRMHHGHGMHIFLL